MAQELVKKDLLEDLVYNELDQGSEGTSSRREESLESSKSEKSSISEASINSTYLKQ